ncbi:MAG: GNAT family protein [Anaerovoracaceae bacterium]
METKNLLIRESTFEDCIHFAKWEVDPAITEFLSFDEERSYEDVVKEFFLDKEQASKLQYTIVKKAGSEPIGRIVITNLNTDLDSLDITKIYIAGEGNRGQGYGKETLTEFLENCFIFLHMERVTLDYFTGNKIACNLYEGLGFQHEGIARHATKKNGMFHDLNLMSMLRNEFFDKVHTK